MGSPLISFLLSVKQRNHQQVCKCSGDRLEPFFVSLCPCYRPSFHAPCNCFKAGLTHQLTQNAPNAKDHDAGAPWQLLNSHSHWLGAPPTWHEAGTSTHVPPLPHRNRTGKWVQGQTAPLPEALAVQSIYRSSKEQIPAVPAAQSPPLPSQHCPTAFRPFFPHLAASTLWVPTGSNTSSD